MIQLGALPLVCLSGVLGVRGGLFIVNQQTVPASMKHVITFMRGDRSYAYQTACRPFRSAQKTHLACPSSRVIVENEERTGTVLLEGDRA